MPPSGYTNVQGRYVASFLESIASSLKNEGLKKQLTPLEVIDAECQNIQVILNEANGQIFADQVLRLTFVFYQRIREELPEDYAEFDTRVAEVLYEVEKQIRAVHVPEIALSK